MEKVLLIVELIGAIIALVPTLISVFCLIKNIIKNKNWKLVEKIALAAMSEVEEYAKEHTTMTSDEKFDMAIQVIKAGLAEANITFDEKLAEQVKSYIENLCKWSKTVNSK
jgi:hypothetical protein